MKLISYTHRGTPGHGLLDAGGITPLPGASLSVLIAENPDLTGLTSAPAIPLEDVTLAPLLPDATRIFCIGTNYRDHVAEVQAAGVTRKQTPHPMVFLRLGNTLAAAGAPILLPQVSDDLDFEGELAVIIGRGGRYIPQDRALQHIAGYSCFNDASLRDWQFHAGQVTPGKNFPATGAFGPWLIPARDIPDPQALSLATRLNGATVQQATTANMIFDVAFLISYLSFFQPLRPGDVIATGTPSGVGLGRTPKLWMRDGDRVEIEISGIGTLTNTVVRDPEGPAPGLAIPTLAL